MGERAEASQMHAFQQWANYRLAPVGKACRDFTMDWRDGTLLVALLKQITDGKVNGKRYRFRSKKPKNEFEAMDNLELAFNFLEQRGDVRLVNIGPGDIFHGNMKLTLGLIWALISAYQIDAHEHGGPSDDDDDDDDAPAIGRVVGSNSASRGTSGAQHLLHWCQRVVEPYEGLGVHVTNFSSSFADGTAFASIIHAFAPDLVNFMEFSDDHKKNLLYVMRVASEHLGIPAMLGPDDVDLMVANPKSMTKVTQLYVAMLKEQLTEVLPSRRERQQDEEQAADGRRQADAEAVARRQAEAEAEAQQLAEAEAEAQRQAEAEAEAQRLAEAEAEAQRQAEAEAKAQRQAEAEAEAQRLAERQQESLGDNGQTVFQLALDMGDDTYASSGTAEVQPTNQSHRIRVEAAAAWGAGIYMEVRVPPHCLPAQLIDVNAPDGTRRRVAIPPGFPPGSTFKLNFRDAQLSPDQPHKGSDAIAHNANGSEAGRRLLKVRVPQGCVSGQIVDVPAPDGTRRRITIPRGYSEGMIFKLDYHAAPLAPARSVVKASPVRPPRVLATAVRAPHQHQQGVTATFSGPHVASVRGVVHQPRPMIPVNVRQAQNVRAAATLTARAYATSNPQQYTQPQVYAQVPTQQVYARVQQPQAYARVQQPQAYARVQQPQVYAQAQPQVYGVPVRQPMAQPVVYAQVKKKKGKKHKKGKWKKYKFKGYKGFKF